MKKTTMFMVFILLVSFFTVSARAQMMDFSSGQTGADDTAGKTIFTQLQNKQISCQDLTDDDFDKLGDYFMGDMMGSAHDTMDTLMTQRLGDQGEQQMHIAMGKRLSGCDVNAAIPQGANYTSNMMNWGGGNALGIVTQLLIVVFLSSGIVYLWKQISHKGKRT